MKKRQPMITECKPEQYLQIMAFLSLAEHYNQKIADIRKALYSLFNMVPNPEAEYDELDYSGHIDDAVYNNYSADLLLKNLGIKIVE